MQSYSSARSARSKIRRNVSAGVATPSDAKLEKDSLAAETSEELFVDDHSLSSWDDIHWKEHELMEEIDDSFFDLPTYEEVHTKSQDDSLATDSDATDEDDEDGLLPDIDILRDFPD